MNKGLLLLLLLTVSSAHARTPESNEYLIKAGFLLNFVKFVEWPSDAFADDSAPLVVGLIGDDPFGSALDDTVSGKTVNGRRLEVRRLKWGQNLRVCHVLFVSSSERKVIVQLIDHLKGSSVLTVGEVGQFIQQGGIINFVMDANKVRFEINVGMAERARLKMSSKLLVLAKTIKN